MSLFFFLLVGALSAQEGNEHVNVVEVNHDCGEKGMIHLDLLNENEIQDYYWEHDGSTDLILTELEEGVYTFVVIKKSGCVIKAEFEIFEVKECTWEMKIKEDGKCDIVCIVEAYINGVPVSVSALDIVWNDGGSGLIRRIRKDHTFEYCVTIKPAGGDEKCCYFEKCFLVEEDKDCKGRKPKVIVNEFSKNINDKQGYVELLVLGDGSCKGTYDIRGHILDDNNGFLVPANEFVTPFNTEITGITMGYLHFTMHEVWQKVPNGSLILIVQERGSTDSEIPPFDPFDSNGDNVYVVRADDPDLLIGKTGVWNDDEKMMEYQGTFTSPAWDKVGLKSESDGMQVRYPDGSYCHGVARGVTPFSDSSSFELYLTEESFNTGNVRFIKDDYMAKEHFMCSETGGDLQSPGKPNSEVNNQMIAALLDCQNLNKIEYTGDSENAEAREDISTKEGLHIYPNPFTSEISIDFTSNLEGVGEVKLYTISGKEILTETLNCIKGRNHHQLKIEKNTSSSLFILRLSYPSGKQEYRRIIHAH